MSPSQKQLATWLGCLHANQSFCRLTATLCGVCTALRMPSPGVLLQSHGFCGHCGAPTEPIEAGAKRQCTRENKHREYPRTDPVVSELQLVPLSAGVVPPSHAGRTNWRKSFQADLAVLAALR